MTRRRVLWDDDRTRLNLLVLVLALALLAVAGWLTPAWFGAGS